MNLKTRIMKEIIKQNKKLSKNSIEMCVFMKSSDHIDAIDNGRTAYIQGFYEWEKYFKKSKSTFYRMINKLKEEDSNFWYCKTAKLLFYYAT